MGAYNIRCHLNIEIKLEKLIINIIVFVFRHNLRILGLIESDAGMFQCIGSNSAGSIQAAARLEIVTPSKSR